MLYISPKLTLLMLGVVPPVAMGAAVYGRYIKKLSRQTQDALSSATKVAEEKISNIRTVRAFAQEEKEQKRCDLDPLLSLPFSQSIPFLLLNP